MYCFIDSEFIKKKRNTESTERERTNEYSFEK